MVDTKHDLHHDVLACWHAQILNAAKHTLIHRNNQRLSVKFVISLCGEKGIMSLCCCHSNKSLIWTPGFFCYKRETHRLSGRQKSVKHEQPGWAEKQSQRIKSGEKWEEKRNDCESKEVGRVQNEQVQCRQRERERVGRKQFYLHEAYLGSRLQNNGRKRVHGTFPFEWACVPLSRVSWPRAALRSIETSLSVGSSWPVIDRPGKVGGWTSKYWMIRKHRLTYG